MLSQVLRPVSIKSHYISAPTTKVLENKINRLFDARDACGTSPNGAVTNQDT